MSMSISMSKRHFIGGPKCRRVRIGGTGVRPTLSGRRSERPCQMQQRAVQFSDVPWKWWWIDWLIDGGGTFVTGDIHTYKKLFVTRTMSVSWQNRRREQSLVAHGRFKKQQQNNMFLNYVRMSCGYLEVWRSRFVKQHNWKREDLLMCTLKALLQYAAIWWT